MRSATLFTTVALAALALAAPATARGPEVDRGSFEYGDTVDCGGFELEYEGLQYFAEKLWLGPDGEPTLITLKFRFRETDVNTTSLKTLATRGSWTETYDLVAGTRTITGEVFMGNEPGSGTFIHDSGKLVLDIDTDELISIAGPHEGYFGGIDEVVCAGIA